MIRKPKDPQKIRWCETNNNNARESETNRTATMMRNARPQKPQPKRLRTILLLLLTRYTILRIDLSSNNNKNNKKKKMTSCTVPLRVKWNKRVIDLDLDPVMIGVKGLKEELHAQTGVPVARMKLMAKSKGLWKGVLSDALDLSAIDWSAAVAKQSPLQLLLMGSAEKIQNEAALKQKTVFIEDLPEEQRAVHAEPAGLNNLGNTCYLNSVVQCLRTVPEFRETLLSNGSSSNNNHNNNHHNSSSSNDQTKQFLVQALRETYTQLDRQTNALPPAALVQAVKMVWPQFAQTTPQGHPMQQDAEELYSNLMAALHDMGLKINDLFGIKMTETLTCNDIPEEPPVVKQDLHRKLTCNIQGGGVNAANATSATATAVNHVGEGILLGLKGEIEKHSDIAGRDCLWTRTQRIQSLPPIITVQFGRFYWCVRSCARARAPYLCSAVLCRGASLCVAKKFSHSTPSAHNSPSLYTCFPYYRLFPLLVLQEGHPRFPGSRRRQVQNHETGRLWRYARCFRLLHARNSKGIAKGPAKGARGRRRRHPEETAGQRRRRPERSGR